MAVAFLSHSGDDFSLPLGKGVEKAALIKQIDTEVWITRSPLALPEEAD